MPELRPRPPSEASTTASGPVSTLVSPPPSGPLWLPGSDPALAFHPEENPLNVPLVQVSLYHSEDPDLHYRLGQAVAPLRDEGVVIIGAGMSVHNLRDMWAASSRSQPMPYVKSFDDALRDAAVAPPEERQAAMAAVARRPDAKQAHPVRFPPDRSVGCRSTPARLLTRSRCSGWTT